MYQYIVKTHIEHNKEIETELFKNVKPEYVKLNQYGFADILSCCLETTNNIRWAKNKIEHIKENIWEEIKKATNPFELIYATPGQSIANIKPLSRSFFKMIEICNEFANEYMDLSAFISLHIAEGPGGFIEATRYLRKLKSKRHNNDIAFGITLMNNTEQKESNIPAWRQSNIFLRNHPEVIISYGADGTGNIYNPDNINYLFSEINSLCQIKNIQKLSYNEINKIMKNTIFSDISEYNNNIFSKLNNILTLNPENNNEYGDTSDTSSNEINKGDSKNNNEMNKGDTRIKNENNVIFITADGGFDYSIDYNYQEQASSKLIFSQIITALKCQAIGGMFICKIFDMNLLITIEMIYILHLFYKQIIIYKPFTSRIANSEKYLICKGFIGIEHTTINKLCSILKEWNKANQTGTTINCLGLEIPCSFIDELKQINKIISNKQINIINHIMLVYQRKLNLDLEWTNENFKKQYTNAIDWCKKNNIPFNEIEKYKK